MLQIGSFIYVQTILEPRKLDSNRTLQDLRKRQIELSMVLLLTAIALLRHRRPSKFQHTFDLMLYAYLVCYARNKNSSL